MEHPDWGLWAKVLFFMGVASLGGGLGHVMRESDKGNRILFWRVLLNMAGSGFVGLLVTFLCRAMKLDDLWTGFVVGVFGWLGATVSIQLLERVVYKKLNIPLRANTEQRVTAQDQEEQP
ncbi:phage holin family protein [Novosphingobium resinovorum]|uniref:phage holin family protein n=1 Tax=Novosphingobium resinovorum TaxID=158500 RepID=UPI002ED3CC78|nr:phage holin family protein [Novosphingobium resinovorum]